MFPFKRPTVPPSKEQFIKVLRDYQKKRTNDNSYELGLLRDNIQVFMDVLKMGVLTKQEIFDLIIFEWGHTAESYLRQNLDMCFLIRTMSEEQNLSPATKEAIETLNEILNTP